MSAQVLTAADAKKAKIDLIENGRGTQAVHDMVVAMRANRRTGSACTKTKAEIAYTGKKPWRQKGTGRARAGYKSSTIWRGGGVVFGPKPRDYSKKVSKSARRLAFRKAISERILAGDMLLVEPVEIAEPSTKKFLETINEHIEAGNVLLVAKSFTDNTYKSARNVRDVLLMTADEVNTEHMLTYDKILVTNDALEKLAERTTK